MNIFKKRPSKKTIIYTLFILWFIFSFWYIVSDSWNNFKTKELQAAYKKGGSDAVLNILKISEGCKIVSLFGQDKKETKFVDISCLNNEAGEGGSK